MQSSKLNDDTISGFMISARDIILRHFTYSVEPEDDMDLTGEEQEI
jgi:hypothetical protein